MTRIVLAALVAAIMLDFMPAVPAKASAAGFSAYDSVAGAVVEKRRKKRIKGGSGCDDPRDVIEHPACR